MAETSLLSDHSMTTNLAFGVASFVLAPTLEELLHRGILLEGLSKFTSERFAVSVAHPSHH